MLAMEEMQALAILLAFFCEEKRPTLVQEGGGVWARPRPRRPPPDNGPSADEMSASCKDSSAVLFVWCPPCCYASCVDCDWGLTSLLGPAKSRAQLSGVAVSFSA